MLQKGGTRPSAEILVLHLRKGWYSCRGGGERMHHTLGITLLGPSSFRILVCN